MIPESHRKFVRWAEWQMCPVGGVNLGLGPTIESKIMEGKGQLLPSAKSRGTVHASVDPVALKVEQFLRTVSKGDRRLALIFYTFPGVIEDKAKELRLPVRTMYFRIHCLHVSLERYCE